MASKVRVGIVGAGGIARNVHIPGYQVLDDVEVVAVCDIAPGRAQEVAAEFRIASAYDDLATMLDGEDLDAVSVCTPNVAHKEGTLAALGAGLHVLCEKPIAMNLAEGREMVAAARERDRILQIGLHFRFQPESLALKRMVERGDLGDIYYGEATMLRRRGIPSWGVFTRRELQGGGALIDIGVHALDHTMWLMGNPKPLTVSGATYAAFGPRDDVAPPRWGMWDANTFDVDDMGVAFVRFEGGATLVLRSAWAAHIGDNLAETRVLGTHGGAFLSPLQIYRDVDRVMVDITPTGLPTTEPHRAEIAHFVSCVRGECECAVRPETVLDVQAVLDAVYASAESGREVAVGA